MTNVLENFFKNSEKFHQHLIIGLLIRIILVFYGELHDQLSELPYTDIDYKVVTDGAKYMLAGKSPFERHTFRYSPIMAVLLIPNILIHNTFGKLLFALFDIFVTVLIQQIVCNELMTIFYETAIAISNRQQQTRIIKNTTININKIKLPQRYKNWANIAALVWLYNPLTIIISTRGNGDSISCFFILQTIYFVHKFQRNSLDALLCGIFYGIAIHLRLYPIIYCLALFLSFSTSKITPTTNVTTSVASLSVFNELKIILIQIFRPNKQQLLLIFGTLFSLSVLTITCYHFYGFTYLQESMIYHLTRKDIRHNFSLYFLMQYLSNDSYVSIFEKILIILPKFIILFYLSLTFGQNLRTLSFCLFAQTFILVTYNSVVTSQYFIWYLALFPLCIKNLRNLKIKLAITYFCLWLLGQALWLLPAYLLEYKCWNTFNFIGIQGICFFFINIFILQRFIYNFDVISKIKNT